MSGEAWDITAVPMYPFVLALVVLIFMMLFVRRCMLCDRLKLGWALRCKKCQARIDEIDRRLP